jgi:transmembrane 9 superfamily protein 2/4
VFRPPQRSLLLATYVGTGVQLFASLLVTMVFALLGFLSPANRWGRRALLYPHLDVAAAEEARALRRGQVRSTAHLGPLFLPAALPDSCRGGLTTAMLLMFVFMGILGGYFAARLYKSLKGEVRGGCLRSHGRSAHQRCCCCC